MPNPVSKFAPVERRMGTGSVEDMTLIVLKVNLTGVTLLVTHDNSIRWTGIAEHVPCNLFHEIGMGRILIEQGDVAGQSGPHGLETLDLKLQQCGAIDQSGASLETVPAVDRMVGEVSCETQAGKQHRDLRQLRPPYLEGATRHLFELTIRRKRLGVGTCKS